MSRIEVYDTTLRDGAQGEGISFSVEDKRRITQLLDELGVDYVEGGWPNPSSPRDTEFFAVARELDLKHVKLAAFGSTRRAGVEAADDPQLAALISSDAPVSRTDHPLRHQRRPDVGRNRRGDPPVA